MAQSNMKKYVLIIPDGAGDLYRDGEGRSPLGLAQIPNVDQIAKMGICGRLQTLFPSLARGSLVAHLGILGWNPYDYYPCGRASAEILATHRIYLGEGDLAFRMNFVRFEESVLASYNADYIQSEQAAPLVEKINDELKTRFPECKLYHCSDFRNTLVVRGAHVSANDLVCIEPHENVGCSIDISELIVGKDLGSQAFADRINSYLLRVASILGSETPNALFPWSASESFRLPSFSVNTGFPGKVGVIGAMEFLHGIAIAGAMDFFPVGSGRPDTDFESKGSQVLDLLRSDYGLIVCHINAPDEASHMGNLDLKVRALEAIDEFVVKPVLEYFQRNAGELGGVILLPDHYTNVFPEGNGNKRKHAHSMDPVPFALWNGEERDSVEVFSEESVLDGRYGQEPIPSLALIALLTGKFKSFSADSRQRPRPKESFS